MKLSLKTKAFGQAIGLFALSLIAGGGLSLALSKIPAEAVPWIAMAGLAGIAINILYSVALSRLEHREALKRLNKLNEKA